MNKMYIHIGICDDQASEIDRMVKYCKSYFEFKYMTFKFTIFNSGEDVFAYKGIPIDILFLDIGLPGITGIQVKDNILHRSEFAHIVFVSSFENYVFEAYSVKTIGYEIKPCTQNKVNKYLSYITQKKRTNHIIRFNAKDADTFVKVNDLYYIKGCYNYSEVFARNKHFIIVYTLKQIEEQFNWLPLVRAHRSYLVNMSTSYISGTDISFYDNDTIIKCSRRKIANVQKQYANYEFQRVY